MVKAFAWLLVTLSVAIPLSAQGPRLWVLTEPNTVIEYDPANFARKQSVTVPNEVAKAARIFQINRKGQMLYAPNSDDPSPDAGKSGERFWFWDGHTGAQLGREIIRISSQSGSNQKVTEASPWPFLSADGTHLYWFANQYNKLERENVELSVTTTFRAWQSDLTGRDKRDLATFDFPECRCSTGSCSETCPEARSGCGRWRRKLLLSDASDPGADRDQISHQHPLQRRGECLDRTDLPQALQRALDMEDNGEIIISAILDVGCCGWENQSNHQTILSTHGTRWSCSTSACNSRIRTTMSLFHGEHQAVAGKPPCGDDH